MPRLWYWIFGVKIGKVLDDKEKKSRVKNSTKGPLFVSFQVSLSICEVGSVDAEQKT